MNKKVSANTPEIQANSLQSEVKFVPPVELPQSLFGLKTPHTQAIFDSILAERASRRFSNHKVKSRAEVSGTGKKP